MLRPNTLHALLAIVFLAVAPALADAQSAGYPDPSFGTNGIAPLASFGVGQLGAIGLQHFGGEERIVALGPNNAWKLARYKFTQRGVQLDTSFGVQGYVTAPVNGANARLGMVVQADNKLVVVGVVTKSRKEGGVLTVARYTENGVLDTSFGDGGIVTLPAYSNARLPRLQSDGKILLAVAIYPSDTVVIRLNQDGTPDPTFGETGVVTLANVGSVYALVAQPVQNEAGQTVEEKIVVTTARDVPTDADPNRKVGAVVRLKADGTLDATFPWLAVGAHGTYPADVTVDGAGRIVVGGSASYQVEGVWHYDVMVARYRADGVLDATFGPWGGGVSTQHSPGGVIENVAIGSDGKILVVGYPTPTYPNSRGLLVWRFDESGQPDASFGDDGLMFTLTTDSSGEFDPFGSMWAFGPGPIIAFPDAGNTFLVGGVAYVAQSKRVVTAVAALGRFVY